MENNTTKYGNLYNTIALGYSERIIEDESYFFKHPTQAEYFSIYGKYESIINEAKKKGLLDEQEKLDFAIQNEWWTESKEDQYLKIQSTIKNLQKTRSNLILPSQRASIDEQIQKNRYILATFQKERYDVIGYTAESYANDRMYDEMLFILTYKNANLTEKAFTDIEEYYYIPSASIERLRNEFIADSNLLSYNSIKKIAACIFFQNMLYITSDCDVLSFWGKSASECTKHQVDLLINGKVFKNAIKNNAENGHAISDDILSNPDKFVQWYDLSVQNASSEKNSSSKYNTQSAVSSFVGATKEDLQEMGVKVEKIQGKSLLELAKDNGGVLEKHQYLNARQGS